MQTPPPAPPALMELMEPKTLEARLRWLEAALEGLTLQLEGIALQLAAIAVDLRTALVTPLPLSRYERRHGRRFRRKLRLRLAALAEDCDLIREQLVALRGRRGG